MYPAATVATPFCFLRLFLFLLAARIKLLARRRLLLIADEVLHHCSTGARELLVTRVLFVDAVASDCGDTPASTSDSSGS